MNRFNSLNRLSKYRWQKPLVASSYFVINGREVIMLSTGNEHNGPKKQR